MKKYKLLFYSLFAGFCFLALFSTYRVELPGKQKPILFYSNLHGNLKKVASLGIKKAKRSLVVNTYSLSDPDIIELLTKRAGEGVVTHLTYDLRATPELPEALWHCHPTKGRGLMHEKILLIDGKRVLLGSANLTTTSLRIHENLCICLYSPALSTFFSERNCLHDTFLFGEQSIDAYLLPDKEKKALCHLVDLIDQSRKKIFVAIFTLTHPDLVEALIRAKKRGVGVKVAIDAYNAGGASKKAVLQLKAENIPIYVSQGWQLFHHKWALIDHHLVLGSANWTRAAFEKNRECLIFLSPLKKEQKKFFHNIKRSIVKKNGTDTKKTADSPSIFSNLSCKRSWDFIYSSAA